ncbi:hypothetical protein [Proteiniborus sp. DW1]|uniref:hypothetical protein n=1 Tax=Proteiniborus sp. DW1 TaxID=1889883 RepID=UPI00117ADE78|nr:hypothetical protein [Proteiniborus sp. DW1]
MLFQEIDGRSNWICTNFLIIDLILGTCVDSTLGLTYGVSVTINSTKERKLSEKAFYLVAIFILWLFQRAGYYWATG